MKWNRFFYFSFWSFALLRMEWLATIFGALFSSLKPCLVSFSFFSPYCFLCRRSSLNLSGAKSKFFSRWFENKRERERGSVLLSKQQVCFTEFDITTQVWVSLFQEPFWRRFFGTRPCSFLFYRATCPGPSLLTQRYDYRWSEGSQFRQDTVLPN